MHMFKLLFQELQVPPTTLLRQLTSWGTAEDVRSHSVPGRDGCLSPGQLPPRVRMLQFFNLIFPEFQNPSLHLVLYKKAGVEGNGRWSVRAQTHSEITSHLNKAPIKIRSLSLLTEFGMWQATRIPAFLVSLAMIIANFEPWLVWLSGLSTSLWTKRLLVQFPTRAHAWVPNQSTCLGCQPGPQ